MLDQAQSNIRSGEELPLAALQSYLQTQLATTADLEILQFPGGHSNLTYLLRLGEREMVLRKPPAGAKHIKGGHDMKREYRILSLLAPVYPKVPKVILFCEDEQIIGTEFYLMERLQGVVIRSRKPEGLALTPAFVRQLSTTFIDNFVALQEVTVRDTPLAQFGKPEGYVSRQIEGTRERYYNVATDDIPEVEQIVDWLRRHQPSVEAVSVIHNDYKFDNVAYTPDFSEVIGVFDWEMATTGDPFADLGMVMGYWVEAGELNLLNTWATSTAGAFTRQELLEYYEEKRRLKVPNPLFYYVLSLFKNCVVAQQLYYRYAKGFTQDERLGKVGQFVRPSIQQTLEIIRSGRLSKA